MSGFLFLTSCSPDQPATIDGTSAASFRKTTITARDDLPAADRLDFDRALASVGSRRFANADKAALARTTFDGMTAEQVVTDFRARHR